MIQSNGGQFYIGVVEDRIDPLMLGRMRVRVVGLHTHDKVVLPTEDLPWAMLMQPVTGVPGATVIPPPEGTSVIVIFNDWPENQQPIVIGILNGIPQTQSVHVDEFQKTPLFRDEITPAGRPIPTTPAEVDANHVGPITTQNNQISAITNLSQNQVSNSPFGLLQTFLGKTASSASAVGGLLGGVGGVGSTYGIAKNSFENLLLGTGNVDSAIGRFKILATQSGPLGSGLVAVLNGKASLNSLISSSGLSLNNIQSSFNSIRNVNFSNPSSILGVITNVQQIAGQVASLSTTASGLLNTVVGELSQVTLAGTVGALLGNVRSFVTSIFGEFGGITSAGLGQLQTAVSFFGLGNVTGGLQSAIGGGIKPILENPVSVSNIMIGPYSSKKSADINAGNIAVTRAKPIVTLESPDFIPPAREGGTPPVYGVYGGPNYGGASPVIEPPVIDENRYAGGSKAEIPLTPPADWKGNRAKAEEGIKALLKAADKYGMKTNEQKCALLAIVGGECNWIPSEESAQYTRPERLMEIFPSTFKGKIALAELYSNWIVGKKGTKEEFFNFVYDPANNGRQLGNSQPGDGGKFFGRGFIQLTGRANYERYARLSGYAIVAQPELLVTDINISAEVAVLYLLDRSKEAVPTAHPQYFYAAKKCVGNNSADIAARKLVYYEHFYQMRTPEGYGYGDKLAGNTQNPYSFYGSLLGNEAGKPRNEGFVDPHNKYPLKRYTSEQETNRLARGVVRETIVPLKESQRTLGIPLSLDAGYFDQPKIPYGAKYPYNKVMETESGHVQEFDDTPGYERIHTYHRSGTFDEIDASGTKVTKIVGDGYTIYDRNGFISIAGEANVTVSGNVNIYCRSDANIEVAGSAEMKVGGNFDIGVARDMNIAVEGNFSLWANGTMNLQARKKAHIMTTEDDMYITSNNELHTYSKNHMFVKSEREMHLLSVEDMCQQSSKDHHIKAADDAFVTIGKKYHVRASQDLLISTDRVMHLLADVVIRMSGTVRGPTQASLADNTKPALKALVHGMIPPPLGIPINPIVEPIKSPPTLGEEKYMYELPEEGATPISQAYIVENVAQEGKANLFESEKAAGGGAAPGFKQSSKLEEIMATDTFTADFKLSEHFTLGMMFDGGFNARHKLVDQSGLTRQQIVANLSTLCENILERYLEVLPEGIQGYGRKWKITSGYRKGTSEVSDHTKGRAVDIALIGGRERKELHFQLIKELDKLVSYDQLILEFEGANSTWIHTSFRDNTYGGGSNRRMAFTMNNHKTYGQGFILLG
jgi:predicted chitinase